MAFNTNPPDLQSARVVLADLQLVQRAVSTIKSRLSNGVSELRDAKGRVTQVAVSPEEYRAKMGDENVKLLGQCAEILDGPVAVVAPPVPGTAQ